MGHHSQLDSNVMIRSSFGQWNADTARQIYQMAGSAADALVKAGKITAEERSIAFMKLASNNLTKYGISVPKEMLAASKDLPVFDTIVANSKNVAGSITTRTATAAENLAISSGSTIMKQTALESGKGALRSAAPVAAVMFAAEGVYNITRFAKGQISGKEVLRRTACSAVSNASGVGGSAIGAAIGSVVPVIGTAVGAAVGGLVAGMLSRWAMETVTR